MGHGPWLTPFCPVHLRAELAQAPIITHFRAAVRGSSARFGGDTSALSPPEHEKNWDVSPSRCRSY